MISTSAALFQTATNGIRAVTASAAMVKFFWSRQIVIGRLRNTGVALADLTINFRVSEVAV
jgi:hypothetical protein